VICVPLTTTTLSAAVPANVTAAPAAKAVPVIVTAVTPAVGPLFGDTLLTVVPATRLMVALCELLPRVEVTVAD
jgi:hypothetical protein